MAHVYGPGLVLHMYRKNCLFGAGHTVGPTMRSPPSTASVPVGRCREGLWTPLY
jgi:hypothetical protein